MVTNDYISYYHLPHSKDARYIDGRTHGYVLWDGALLIRAKLIERRRKRRSYWNDHGITKLIKLLYLCQVSMFEEVDDLRSFDYICKPVIQMINPLLRQK